MSVKASRLTVFQRCNQDTEHQRLAGAASWTAFSARWRAHQGLPLLHPMDVQYLTPQDFCNGLGHPLPPTEQRRLFRGYVEAALQVYLATGARLFGRRRELGCSADLAFVRADGFVRSLRLRQDVVYGGREDVKRYESEALLPTRPYGIPVTSTSFPSYWLVERGDEDEDNNGDEAWMVGEACHEPVVCEDGVGTEVPDDERDEMWVWVAEDLIW